MEAPRKPLNPADAMTETGDVLSFVCQSLSWATPGDDMNMGGRAASGLWLILSRCIRDLDKAKENIA